MKASHPWLLALALLAAACSDDRTSEDVAGGGFETSDLQVSVVDESGGQLVGARAWLLGSVDSANDTLEVPVDSGLSDGSGKVRFARGSLAGERMGVEAWSGDTMMAVHTRMSLVSRDTFTIVLRRARVLTLPCMAFPSGTVLRMPGSHFEQRPPAACLETFRILVPPMGGFILAFTPHPGPPLRVFFGPDSLPFFRPSGPPPIGNGPPPFGLDSLRFPPPPIP
jgi:hypothetical protein